MLWDDVSKSSRYLLREGGAYASRYGCKECSAELLPVVMVGWEVVG